MFVVLAQPLRLQHSLVELTEYLNLKIIHIFDELHVWPKPDLIEQFPWRSP